METLDCGMAPTLCVKGSWPVSGRLLIPTLSLAEVHLKLPGTTGKVLLDTFHLPGGAARRQRGGALFTPRC